MLAEDDLLLGDGIAPGCAWKTIPWRWMTDGVAAENALVTDEFDLLVLDIRAAAPRQPGTSCVTCATRAHPVLLLTAGTQV